MPRRLEIPESDLRRMIEDEKLTQHEVARRLGVHTATIERRCRALRLKTQRRGPRSGELHTNWKGGRVLVGGYAYLYRPDHPGATKRGYVLEHRVAMEAQLGRLLGRSEVVHHAHGDRLDNAPENLAVFATNAEHLRHELTGRCPNWTPEGRARISAGLRRSNRLRRRSEERRV